MTDMPSHRHPPALPQLVKQPSRSVQSQLFQNVANAGFLIAGATMLWTIVECLLSWKAFEEFRPGGQFGALWQGKEATGEGSYVMPWVTVYVIGLMGILVANGWLLAGAMDAQGSGSHMVPYHRRYAALQVISVIVAGVGFLLFWKEIGDLVYAMNRRGYAVYVQVTFPLRVRMFCFFVLGLIYPVIVWRMKIFRSHHVSLKAIDAYLDDLERSVAEGEEPGDTATV